MDFAVQSFADITGEKIEAATDRIRGVMPESPDVVIDGVLAKLENRNLTGAFKIRGGLIYFDWLKRAMPEVASVVTATRGNHGQSVAFSSARSGLPCRIFVPHGNSEIKNEAMRKLGAEVVEQGADFADAMDLAKREADCSGAHFVPSFDWKLVLGVSTYSYELLSKHSGIETLYIPIGLGSGICGAIAARNALGLRTRIIGVVAERAPAYAESFAAGRLIEGRDIPDTIADGVACRVPNPESFAVIREQVEEVVSVSEEEINAAMSEILEKSGERAEGAGAIAYAAWKKRRESSAAVIVSGGNV
ncbi:MAG: threonine dehydratase [Verrucomicrobiales bacterium]|nr:threonine dehydratase [Verrucomicrobiales bacterium]